MNYAAGGPNGYGNGLRNGKKLTVYLMELDDIDNPKNVELKFNQV
jgi:hypothetical protein